MIIEKFHEINITSRNITKYRELLNDKTLKNGIHTVTSSIILKAGTARINLHFNCDVCGKEYERGSSEVIQTGVDKLHRCKSCTSIESNKKIKESGGYQDMIKRRTESLLSNPDYAKRRAEIGKKYSDNYENQSDEYKSKRREQAIKAQIASIESHKERYKDTSHLNMKYFDETRKRTDFTLINVKCDKCCKSFKKPYRMCIISDVIQCDECSYIQAGKKISKIHLGVPKPYMCGENHHNWRHNKPELQAYRSQVYKFTYRNKSVYSKWDNFDKIGLCGVEGAYQLDHIIPITFGFENNICPWVIGNIDNLQIVPWEINKAKNNHYDGDLDEILNPVTN